MRATQSTPTPPLECNDCKAAIIKVDDTQFVCLGCDSTQQTQSAL